METLLRAMGEMVQIATADARKMNGAVRTHIDLFSGIGGFALACRWAGIETIAFCEIEKYAQRVLRKNFPGIRIFEDVRQFPATQFREPFLLTGGYPCQPFSQAGKRRGAEDDRHLWPSMFGIIRTSRPNWILAENVAGHVSMGLDEVLADLESEDYATQPLIIPACAVNALHRRDRVWVIANANSKRFSKNNIQEKINHQVIGEKQPIMFDLSSRIEQGPRNIRGNDGLSDRVDSNRVKALGNAIVPQVAYEIIKAMIEADESA